ncbi:hypothetical protein DRP77_00610 [Candidatus Poribacteria bacterium]|nr:MAG: hypothetical protein DRP77_00610 [Candidatus Poribacteria bacterium]
MMGRLIDGRLAGLIILSLLLIPFVWAEADAKRKGAKAILAEVARISRPPVPELGVKAVVARLRSRDRVPLCQPVRRPVRIFGAGWKTEIGGD